MKMILFAFTLLLSMVACTNKPATAVENVVESSNVTFEVAKNYFFKNDQVIPEYPKITNEEEFNKLFGMATTMGKDGKPTAIDFTKQFVLAIVLPETDFATEINPVKVEEKGDSLLYTYDVKTGEKQSFTIQPVSIIILDKKYENKEIVLVNKQVITRLQAIVDYLSKEIGSQYAQGEYCVPFYTVISWDDSNIEDIKVWGDFWVFNYNQVGDTLKCVSGGSHPGMMHMQYTAKGFEVTSFDQVEDGSNNLPSAKRIFGDKYDAFHAINSDEKNRERLRAEGLATYAKKNGLAVTLYQDYGWLAKKLEK